MIDPKLPVSVIAALTEKDRVIGLRGDMPWHLPEDLARFKELTMDSTLLMGRKTFESLPGVLPGRDHLILSRNEYTYDLDRVERIGSIAEALAKHRELGGELFVCGGQSVYEAFMSPPYLNHVDNLYLTIIEEEYEGDTFFPEYEEQTDRWFQKVAEEPMDGFRFEDYERSRPYMHVARLSDQEQTLMDSLGPEDKAQMTLGWAEASAELRRQDAEKFFETYGFSPSAGRHALQQLESLRDSFYQYVEEAQSTEGAAAYQQAAEMCDRAFENAANS